MLPAISVAKTDGTGTVQESSGTFLISSTTSDLAALSSASLASPPLTVYSDQIIITGTVYYWTLEDVSDLEKCTKDDNFKDLAGGKYLPLKNTYIESEYDSITSDPSTYTSSIGTYYLKKSGLEEGSYDVDLEVRAKTIMNTRWTILGNRDTVVTIFNHEWDAYAINAQTSDHPVHTGNTLELDIYIGGPKNNLLADNNDGMEKATAFWLAQDLSSYYHEVMKLAPNPSDITWDTYLLYPQSDSKYKTFSTPGKGHLEMEGGRALFPGLYSSQNGYCVTGLMQINWKMMQATARHEYSHQIMDEVFDGMPADDTGEHAPNTCSNAKTAWTEGWAEFLPAVIKNWPTSEGILNKENLEFNYNPYVGELPTRKIIDQPFDLSNQSDKGWGGIMWHYLVRESCDTPENGEGEVAAVLWDIYDPAGWEYLSEEYQPAGEDTVVPGPWKRPLRWYDRLADSYIDDIWTVFKHGPETLTGNHTSNNGSFWALWLNQFRNDPARIHGLKAILFNRGIDPSPKAEHAPSIVSMTIDQANRKINLTISEEDPEDRDFLYFNVGYMKQDYDSEFSYYYAEDRLVSELGGRWQNGQITVSINIPRGMLGRVTGVLVHDSMLAAYKSVTINPQEQSYSLYCASRQTVNFATAVTIQGNYAYVTDMETGLYIYDLSDPLQPAQVGLLRSDRNSAETPWGGARDVAVDGSYAYIAAYSGALVIVDVSNPASPVLKGYVPIEGDPEAIALSGNKAYVVMSTGGLTIFNIQNPNSPVEGRTLGTRGAFDIAVNGSRAFVAVDGGIQIFSLGMFPHYLGVISTSGDSATGVAPGENGMVYLATRNGTMQVFDLSTWQPGLVNLLPFLMEKVDPEVAFPVKIDEVTVLPEPGRIMLSGTAIYGAGGVYDVSSPELVYKMATVLGDEIALKGDVIYAADESNGFLAYSRTKPSGEGDACGLGGGEGTENGYLEAAGTWQGHVSDMAFANDAGFLASANSGLIIVSVKDPKDIQTIATYNEPVGLNAMGVEVDATGTMVFLPSMAGDLQILDITRPEAPKRLGTVAWNKHDTTVGAWQEIAAQYGFVFVCAGTGGVRAMDVRDPVNPNWKGTFTNAVTDCNDIAVSLPDVYALSFTSGLHVFEMNGPMLHTTPQFDEQTGWSLPQGFSGTNYSSLYLDESRKLLYVSSLWNGVTILDISNSSQPPVVLGSIDPGSAYGMTGSGNYLYVGDDYVVHVIDVSDVHHPKVVAEQQLTDHYGLEIAAITLKVYYGYLYVATDQDTLQAYRIIK
jgi:hypothetical protein